MLSPRWRVQGWILACCIAEKQADNMVENPYRRGTIESDWRMPHSPPRVEKPAPSAEGLACHHQAAIAIIATLGHGNDPIQRRIRDDPGSLSDFGITKNGMAAATRMGWQGTPSPYPPG
jgi:hypothetical protein